MVADRIVRLAETDEVAWYQMRSLMDQLVEAVLPVRAGLAPLDRACRMRDALAVAVYGLAVGFHVHLLQICRETAQVLVVRQHRVRLRAVCVRVKYPQKRKYDRQVALEARRAEVLVHLPVAFEEAREVPRADEEHQRKADGGRQGIAPSDPVPEAEHVVEIDAKFRHLGGVGGKRYKVLRHHVVRIYARQLVRKPGAGGIRVGHRLLRGEGLGGHDEESLVGLDFTKRLGKMRGIHVGDEEALDGTLPERRKRDVRHDGTKVAAADSDVDDVLDALAGEAAMFAAANALREGGHLFKRLADVRHDVLAVDEHLRLRVAIAQRRVQNGAVLGAVYLLAREHAFDLVLEPGSLCELQERLPCRSVDAVLGPVERPARRRRRIPRRATGIVREKFLYRLVARNGNRRFHVFPCCFVHVFFLLLEVT